MDGDFVVWLEQSRAGLVEAPPFQWAGSDPGCVSPFLIWVGPPLANLRVGLFQKKTGLGLAAYVSNRAYILVRCRLLRAVVPLSARVD